MALIAIASDKGAPGVTTAALALAAVWPRPVLLAECDPAGGDLVYRFPAAGGGPLDPRRGVLSLAVVARRGMQPQQVWEHAQKLHGGLDVLAGVTNAEQGAGLSLLWGPIGKVLASLPQADVIADCGRLGADGPLYDLLAEATTVVLVTKVQVADVIRLRDRAAAFAAAAQSRGRRGFGVGVVVIADHKRFRAAIGEVQHVLSQANTPATVLGGIAHDSKGADLLSGEWGGNLDRTLLIKTAREVAQHLLVGLPPIASPAVPSPAVASAPMPSPAVASPAVTSPAVTSLAVTSPAVTSPGVTSPAATNLPATSPAMTSPSAAWPAVAGPSGVNPQAVPPLVVPGASSAGPGTSGLSPAEVPATSPAAGLPNAGLPAGEPPAPDTSAGGARTVFSRVRGARTGKHQANPAQTLYVSAPAASEPADEPGQPRARHAQPHGRPAEASGSGPAYSGSGQAYSGSAYPRPPMPPLTSAGSAPEPSPPGEPAEPLEQPGGDEAWTTPW